jgi:acetolactate synthase-1/2/3 large subunit
VAIGARCGEWDSKRWDASIHSNKLIQVAADSGFFSRTPSARLHVLGDIKTVFKKILDYLEDNTFTEITESNLVAISDVTRQRTGKPTRYFALNDESKYLDDSTPLKPQRLMKLLTRQFPHNTKYLADVGASFAWAIHYLHPYKLNRYRGGAHTERLKDVWTGSFRTCLEFSSMGWAQGAAVGTAFATPDDPVVCITGDGSCLMSGAELTTALQHNLTVIFVVLNDSSLGMVAHGQLMSGGESIGSELPEVSFAGVARAMGITAHTIRESKDLLELDIEEIVKSRAPCLLDCIIDKSEAPPIDMRTDSISSNK